MNKMLTRGGIEFLAVLLGISGSLWLDDRSTYALDRKYEIEAYERLSNALLQDIEGLKVDAKKNDRMISVLEKMINGMGDISNDSLINYIDITQSYSDMETHTSDYETLKNTGRLYNVTDIDMLESIIDMYDNKYREIEDWKSEDKRAIWLQDEFFIKNYSMRVAPNWTTIKDIKKDRERLINDSTYQNYLIFLFKVKSRMNEEWGKLRAEMIKLNADITLRLEELVKK
ncbi:MAG: hypothetical protein VX887_03425 [Candidatus Neomarinimicrobiota bacterium]|nr:hypothetical protein [Candidatus Neomarinimicrobiota bacterium]